MNVDPNSQGQAQVDIRQQKDLIFIHASKYHMETGSV